jgi:hypothetical protein
MNRRLLRSIFYEYNKEEGIYTLKDTDIVEVRGEASTEGTSLCKTYPSLRRLYLEEEDVTEYLFANKYLESWEHWTILCECLWFKGIVSRWRTELEMLLQAKALKYILDESISGGKNAYDANKYIVAKGWIKLEGNRRGRPSKQEISRAAAEQAFADYKVQEDAKRLGIN